MNTPKSKVLKAYLFHLLEVHNKILKSHFKSPSSKVLWSYCYNTCIFLNLLLTHTKSNRDISKCHKEEVLQVRGCKEWEWRPTQRAIGENPRLLRCWRACWNLRNPEFFTLWCGTWTVANINHLSRTMHVVHFLWIRRVLWAYGGGAAVAGGQNSWNRNLFLLFFVVVALCVVLLLLLLLEVCCSSLLSCSSCCLWSCPCWCCCCPSRRGHFFSFFETMREKSLFWRVLV